jgi:transposase-like protein
MNEVDGATPLIGDFEAEIIELCVRWYITYRLSYRDLVATMAERGILVSHTTILRWVMRYVPEFAVAAQDHARWPQAEASGPSVSAA